MELREINWPTNKHKLGHQKQLYIGANLYAWMSYARWYIYNLFHLCLIFVPWLSCIIIKQAPALNSEVFLFCIEVAVIGS